MRLNHESREIYFIKNFFGIFFFFTNKVFYTKKISFEYYKGE